MEDIVRFISVSLYLTLMLAALVFLPILIVYLVSNPIDKDAFCVIAFFCLIVATL